MLKFVKRLDALETHNHSSKNLSRSAVTSRGK